MNHQLSRHSRFAPALEVKCDHVGDFKNLSGGRETHSQVHVDGLDRQAWYSLRASIVAARTRCMSVSHIISKANQKRQATERVKSAILNNEPAIAANNGVCSVFTDAYARHLMRHHCDERNKRKLQSWERSVKATPTRGRLPHTHRPHACSALGAPSTSGNHRERNRCTTPHRHSAPTLEDGALHRREALPAPS